MNNFEKHISDYFASLRSCQISEAEQYAMDGGKRFRPRIIFAILNGMNIPEEKGYDAALALELIQTFSLIHDDLPCMDNDDMRRGKPSLHKAFREDIALLAGDEMLNDAYRVISESKTYDDSVKVKLIASLSRYVGLDGMIYGQLLDVTNDSSTVDVEKLFEIQDNKTGGLFKISCLFPMHIAKLDREDYFTKLGSMIGQIFQNQDDLFDIIKTEAEMGKNLSDAKNDKGSALSIYSVEELKKIIDDEFDEIDKYLEDADFDTSYLKELLLKLKER